MYQVIVFACTGTTKLWVMYLSLHSLLPFYRIQTEFLLLNFAACMRGILCISSKNGRGIISCFKRKSQLGIAFKDT